jgi:hypothetical protein
MPNTLNEIAHMKKHAISIVSPIRFSNEDNANSVKDYCQA